MLYCPKEEEKIMKVIFLDIDGVLTHTDYLNWQTRHIDPERVRFLAKDRGVDRRTDRPYLHLEGWI